jgi:hypothetical protein
MALLTPQQVAVTGTKLTYTAADSGGDTIASPGGGSTTVLKVKNGDASAKTVTLVRPGSSYGQANPDVSKSIPAGEEHEFVVPAAFADPADGLVHVSYSAVTSVTVAVARY